MRALVLEQYRQFAVKELPTPEIAPDEVLVRVRACGICGSDVHGMDGSTGRRIPPLVMGHEAAGTIEQVGPSVRRWKAGDRVTFDSTIYCGRCPYCLAGQVNLCDQRQVLGVSCGDYRRNGAFAEFVAVPERVLCRLPEGLAFEPAAMVEAVAVAAHAVGRIADVPRGTAAVIGAGMIGLLVVQVLRACGWEKVIAVDVDDRRLELARQLGATATVNSRGLATLPDLGEIDAAFEVVGMTATVKLALGCLKKGGHAVLVGNLQPQVEIPLQLVVTRQITLHGSCASAGEYPQCLEWMARGQVRVNEIISARSTLEDAAGWFERLHRGEPGLMKVIVTP